MTIPKTIVVTKGENGDCCLVKQKTDHCVVHGHPVVSTHFAKTYFPLGGDCPFFPSMTSFHWHPSGPRGGEIHPDICSSESSFASSASKMGHYSRFKPHPAKWKQQGDLWPKPGEEVGQGTSGWKSVEVLKGTASVSGALRNKKLSLQQWCHYNLFLATCSPLEITISNL